MRWLPILFVLVLSFAGYQSRHLRMNSKQADISKHPYVVGFVFIRDTIVEWRCGGVIFHVKYALTTASCLTGIPTMLFDNGYFRVRSNTSYLESDFQPLVDHVIAQHFIHEDFTGAMTSYDYNIAVVEILDTFTSVYEKEIDIPQTPIQYRAFQRANVFAWRNLLLQDSSVSLVELPNCQTSYRYVDFVIQERMVCGRVYAQENFCRYMDGSPLIYESVLLGLASFAFECSTDHFPAVFIRPDTLRDWIASVSPGFI